MIAVSGAMLAALYESVSPHVGPHGEVFGTDERPHIKPLNIGHSVEQPTVCLAEEEYDKLDSVVNYSGAASFDAIVALFLPERKLPYGEDILLLERSQDGSFGWLSGGIVAEQSEEFGLAETTTSSPSDAETFDYSTTNVQVAAVDEPDFVKNDGKYIYILTDNTLTIIDALPAERAGVVFRLELSGGFDYDNMFLNGDRLAIIYSDAVYRSVPLSDDMRRFRSVEIPTTEVMVMDMADKGAARVSGEYSIDGRYHDARMIGDHVYLVTESRMDYNSPIPPEIRTGSEESVMPLRPEICYGGADTPSTFITVAAVNVQGEGSAHAQVYLLGDGDAVYVSEENIYLTLARYGPSAQAILEGLEETGLLEDVARRLPEEKRDKLQEIVDRQLPASEKMAAIAEIGREEGGKLQDLSPEEEADIIEKVWRLEEMLWRDSLRTVIHKVAIDETGAGVSFRHTASSGVAGRVLNQFSMDEYDGKFRIATTVRDYGVHNNVYVLDESLDLVGSLEEVAHGEEIYSARFMGDKLYLVTFRQIDPFFVIDLSGDVPQILGELKIPGFSNYLHPYGKDGVVGIGRDVGEDGRIPEGGGGIKIAMFDVSDFDNPRLRDEVVIGDRNTDSPGLKDHKAVLIDEGKGILSLPVYHRFLTADSRLPSVGDAKADWWNGFYVYEIGEDGTFEESGTVRHMDRSQMARSLYIEDALYTVTEAMVAISYLDEPSRVMGQIFLR